MKKLIQHLSSIAIHCFFIMAFLQPTNLPASETETHDKIAFVLSGGGARGLSQIGVLKAFEEANIKPDFFAATSMGAIIAALYSAGYSLDSITAIVKSVQWPNIFTNSSMRKKLLVSQKYEPHNYLVELRLNERLEPVTPNSISYGQSFYTLLTPLLAGAEHYARMNFDSLSIPLRIITTDILSGKSVVLSHGSLATALRASCAVPLAFSPVALDSMLLLDGGLSANIPVDAAMEFNPSMIIAIDVTSPLWKKQDLNNPVRLMDQVVAIGMKHKKERDLKNVDFIITPDLAGFPNTDFRPIDTLIARGYAAGIAQIDAIKASLENKETTTALNIGKIVPKGKFSDSVTIKKVTIAGNTITSSKLIKTAAAIDSSSSSAFSSLGKTITSLYATNLFNNVNVAIDSLNTVHIMVDEKNYWRMRVGLRFDEYHLGEGFVQPAYENVLGLGICATLHAQYGLIRERYALEFQGDHLLTTNFANTAKIQTYVSQERTTQRTIERDSLQDVIKLQEITLRKAGVLCLAGIQVGRFAMLTGGFKLELFKIQSTNLNAFQDALGLKFREGLPYFMLRLTMDSMDKFPFPQSGIVADFTVGGKNKPIGGSMDFIKINGSIGRYFTFYNRSTFFPQVRMAWSTNPLPPVEKVYLGGVTPEEGFKELDVYNNMPFVGMRTRSLPGDIMALIHCDYRYSIKRNFYITASTDWGYAWEQEEYKNSDFGTNFVNNAPIGISFGLAYQSFFGPLRLSYGRLIHNSSLAGIISENQLYFSMGYDF